MYFELDEFLATLSGMTREQTRTMISLKLDALISEVSQPRKKSRNEFRSFKFEISFLNELGIELGNVSRPDSSSMDRVRIDNVLRSLRKS